MKSKLAYWMRVAPTELREELARSCDTSTNVLYSIASGRRGNPTLHRAVILARTIADINRRNPRTPLPEVTLDDLFHEAEKYEKAKG